MTRVFILICSFALVWTAGGETESKRETAQAQGSQHVATHSEHATGGSAQPQHTQATHIEHPTGGSAPVQHTQVHRRPPGSGGPPLPSGAGTRPTGPGSYRGPSGNPAAKSAASVPPAPGYHYNFRTKSGVIGRDFTRPLTPEEQTAIAREIEKQPRGTQGAQAGDESGNGAYHYNFRTKSGVIGRDFTRPLTPEEQTAVTRQLEKGQLESTQEAHVVYYPENGAYHYNFRTKSGMIGADFPRPLTPEEQSVVAREMEGGQLQGTQVQSVASTQANVHPFHPRHFNLPSKSDSAIAGVKFKGTGHIPGSETWTDPKYAVFRHYHHEWHDKNWWITHHSRIVLVSAGWYYLNAGYWHPAWGYDPASSSYPYDGPIYAYNDLAPDQVIANVQAALQALGYYNGSINGILDSDTRAAIASYQQGHGLYMTSAIDEATLAALGMT